MDLYPELLYESAMRDAVSLLCGERLGVGAARQVYVYQGDPTQVIKFEGGAGWFQNQQEWAVWSQLQHTSAAKWLAPCDRISDSGMWLIQKRTFPASQEQLKSRLKRVPVFFTDLKSDNWGWLGNRIVCHDYGMVRLFNRHTEMRKANWRC